MIENEMLYVINLIFHQLEIKFEQNSNSLSPT